MKKFFNHATILLVATLFTLSACLTENELRPYDPIDGESVSVSIQFDQAEFETRAVGPPPSLLAPTIQTGDLFLVSSTGAIIEHFAIVQAGGTANGSNGRINVGQITGGNRATIPNVPASIRNGEVVFIGNNTSVITTTGNINDIIAASSIDIRNQSSHYLFGRAPLQYVSTNAGVQTWAPPVVSGVRQLRVAPVVARLEFNSLVGVGLVQGFEVEGVFIDNYFRQARVTGAPIMTSLRDNIAANRVFDNNSSSHPTAFIGHTWDWHNPGLPSASGNFDIPRPGGGYFTAHNARRVMHTAAGYVWYYYLFAHATTVPRIVFRLRNVQVAGEPNPRPVQFVTFHNFVRHADGSTVAGLSPRLVYRVPLNSLVFSEHDLRGEPSTLSTLSTRAIPIEIIE